MKIHTTVAALAIAALFTGCAKDGAEGPAGPAGPSGPQGNANVQSVTFSVSPGDWSSMSGGYSVNRNTDIITEEIVNSGSVLAYAKFDDTWAALPFSQGEIGIAYQYGVGHLQIEIYTANPITQVTEWKVVAIASSGMIMDSGVDVHDYEAVRDHFGLTD